MIVPGVGVVVPPALARDVLDAIALLVRQRQTYGRPDLVDLAAELAILAGAVAASSPPPRPSWTIEEYHAATGVPETTLRYWCRHGRIDATLEDGAWRIHEPPVEAGENASTARRSPRRSARTETGNVPAG